MKKNIVSGIFALALLVTAGYGVNKSMKSNANLRNLALSNVDALASGESEEYSGCKSGSGYCAIYWNGEQTFSSYSHYPY